MTPARLLAITAVAVLGVAACGDDEEPAASFEVDPATDESSDQLESSALSEADQELADAIAADLAANDEAGFADVFDTQCMAEGTVAALGGADAIESEYGVTPEAVGAIGDTELSADDARAVAAAYGECGDFVELFVRTFAADGFPEDQARCLLDGVDDDLFEQLIAAGFSATGESAAQDALTSILNERAASCTTEA
ncbi:MAG: hypothetical protein AAF945_05675 [Actinomycetota bacterium]